MTMPRLGRSLAALAAVALLTAVTGCTGGSDDPVERVDPAPTSDVAPTSEDETTSDAPATEDGSGPAIPLSEELSTEDPASWALPVVSGWSVPQEVQSGIFQISKEGGEALVTAYQLDDPSASDAEQGARAWLENYHSQVAGNSEASDVSEPTYGTTDVASTRGPMEFVVQELEYGTPDGTRYRSWYVARWIDGYLFGLQYAAPEDEWSEQEWAQLTEEGLKLAL